MMPGGSKPPGIKILLDPFSFKKRGQKNLNFDARGFGSSNHRASFAFPEKSEKSLLFFSRKARKRDGFMLLFVFAKSKQKGTIFLLLFAACKK